MIFNFIVIIFLIKFYMLKFYVKFISHGTCKTCILKAQWRIQIFKSRVSSYEPLSAPMNPISLMAVDTRTNFTTTCIITKAHDLQIKQIKAQQHATNYRTLARAESRKILRVIERGNTKVTHKTILL